MSRGGSSGDGWRFQRGHRLKPTPGFGVLGVVGGELRLGATSRLGVFLEGHGMAAKGYGVEAAGGLRLAMGRALTATP